MIRFPSPSPTKLIQNIFVTQPQSILTCIYSSISLTKIPEYSVVANNVKHSVVGLYIHTIIFPSNIVNCGALHIFGVCLAFLVSHLIIIFYFFL